jgi:hypothetical protein
MDILRLSCLNEHRSVSLPVVRAWAITVEDSYEYGCHSMGLVAGSDVQIKVYLLRVASEYIEERREKGASVSSGRDGKNEIWVHVSTGEVSGRTWMATLHKIEMLS